MIISHSVRAAVVATLAAGGLLGGASVALATPSEITAPSRPTESGSSLLHEMNRFTLCADALLDQMYPSSHYPYFVLDCMRGGSPG